MYSRFANGLTKSNIRLDRKILADIAVNEPLSFKCVLDEIVNQGELEEIKQKPHVTAATMSISEALGKDYLSMQKIEVD